LAFLNEPIDPSSQPLHQADTALCQPLLGEAKKPLQRFRRTITDRDDREEIVRTTRTSVGQLREKKFDTVEQLRAAVFEVLVKRLKNHGVESSQLDHEDRFRWILPTKYVNHP
jgi:hypothetical protein